MNAKRMVIVSAGIVTALISIGHAMPTETHAPRKMSILVHVTHGPESATRAALGFLVARTAAESGHSVSVFLAGDAVGLLRDTVLDSVTGVGTGSLREHYDAIVKGGGRFYLSGMSSKARGITDADLKGKPAELAPPNVLLRLAIEHERMFTY
jgi:predicted peroxiredoxin